MKGGTTAADADGGAADAADAAAATRRPPTVPAAAAAASTIPTTLTTSLRQRRSRDMTTRRRDEMAELLERIAALELEAQRARQRNEKLRRVLAARTVGAEARGVLQRLGFDLLPRGHQAPPQQQQQQQQQQQHHRRCQPRRSPRASAAPPAVVATVSLEGGLGNAVRGSSSSPGSSSTTATTKTTKTKTTTTTTTKTMTTMTAPMTGPAAAGAAAAAAPPPPTSAAAAAAAAAVAAATQRVFLPPEHHDMLEASIFGMLAREHRDGGGGGDAGSNDATSKSSNNSNSNSTTTIVARASAVLASLVAERRERAQVMSVRQYLRILQDFNSRAALAIWRASIEREAEEELGRRRAAGQEQEAEPHPSSSSRPPPPLDAALNPLVKDRVGWLAALGRYQRPLLRRVTEYDIDTLEPLALSPLANDGAGADADDALAREDARLLTAARQARFSPNQLSMLAVLYEQHGAAVRRGDEALCAAARDLGAASASASAAAATTATAAPPLAAAELWRPHEQISRIEAALQHTLEAASVASGALFQTITPVQYATLCAALHPRVTPFPALLRAGWLLHSERSG